MNKNVKNHNRNMVSGRKADSSNTTETTQPVDVKTQIHLLQQQTKELREQIKAQRSASIAERQQRRSSTLQKYVQILLDREARLQAKIDKATKLRKDFQSKLDKIAAENKKVAA
jgi:predicted  nucleic acid-binding Zn-ribbon protein